ncbi:MAG: SulP family inorganic anion transporter [Pseudomonadota bacterium]
MHAPSARNPWVSRILPFLRWWPTTTRETARADLIAGLTGAIIVLPQGVAFATIAGMPPEYGLYAAMVPAIIAALFGSSWHLVSGPTTAISIVVFSAVSPLADPGSPQFISLVLTLTFLTGIFQLGLGLARMGMLVNFISHTVVIGFTAGAAVLIASSQLKNFFGIHVPHGASFHETVYHLFLQWGHINPYITAVGVATLASGILVKRYLPRIPYMIAAMIVGSVAALLFDHLFGAETTGIKTVGALPAGLPPLSLPDFSPEAIRQTAPSALAVAMLGLTEAVSIARAIAVRSEQRIDGNQEFIGQGLSNLLGSFFSGYASSGSFNRSGLNYAAGARTPLAAVFAALFLVVILLLVAPLAAYLPIPAMAGILFLVAWGLIDFHHIRSIVKTSRPESFVLFTTLLATLFVELEFAIYVGVVLSLMVYLNRTSQPSILTVMPDQEEGSYHFTAESGLPDCPQLKIVRINGSIFFGAVDHVQRFLQRIDEADPQQKHVLIIASGINFVDVAGAEMLAQEAKRRRKMGGGLYFYRMKDAVREMLAKGNYLKDVGEENIFPAKFNAIGAICRKLDPEVCRGCNIKVFRECKANPAESKMPSQTRIPAS